MVQIASDECRFCNDLACEKDIRLLTDSDRINFDEFGHIYINDIKYFLSKCRALEDLFPF